MRRMLVLVLAGAAMAQPAVRLDRTVQVTDGCLDVALARAEPLFEALFIQADRIGGTDGEVEMVALCDGAALRVIVQAPTEARAAEVMAAMAP